ncbi:MAG: PEP-CTERM sorting domain-containing protein, partial [Pirellulales bacterium]|nr:PEP-CTERM sorting domain-containing protein [Pirellulales bacterium]
PVNGEISAAGGFIYQYGGNYDQATAAGGTYQLEGGTIHQLTATPGGALNIYGGEVTDRASLDMGNYVQLGGTVHTVVADNISGVYLFDGIISTNVGVANGSSLNIQNGSINQNVTVIESQLYMFGGSVAGDVELANNSNADIYGGTISGNLRVSSNAQVLLGGSVAGDIDGDDHATIQLFEGASVGGQVRLIKYSKLSADLMNNTGLFIDSVRSDVSLLRSHVGAVRVMDHSKLSIEESRLHGGLTAEKTFIQFNSGDVDLQFTLLSSDVRFNRGCIHTDLIATGDSKVRMSGGNISGDVYIRNYSSFRMTGGRINGKLVVASQNATVNLIGGYIGGLIIGDPLEITFASVLDNPMLDSLTGLVALDDAVINIYGTDLVATLVDPVYQDGMFSLYEFTGILSDGTQVLGGNLVIQNGTTASFHFLPPIPEPGTAILLLALLPLAGTLWWRQRSGNSSMDQPTFQQALTTAPIQAACDLGIELAEPMDNSETVGSLHGHLRSHVISPKYAPISVMPSGLN